MQYTWFRSQDTEKLNSTEHFTGHMPRSKELQSVAAMPLLNNSNTISSALYTVFKFSLNHDCVPRLLKNQALPPPFQLEASE
uniref:Uncharacterized protein n=1 Tax=Arundo donax TaxID=35708 RepID=A0A0A9DS05_ARUDO